MNSRILIMGGGAAGQSAAAAARKTNRQAEIILVSRERYPTYSRCGLPYVIGREIPNFEDLVLFPMDYYRNMKIDLRLETEAVELDARSRTAVLQDRDGRKKIEFDSLVLATGASSFVPSVKGSDLSGIHTIRTIDDGKTIEGALAPGKKAVVVGGGITAVELADGLAKRELKTTILYRKQYLLRMMFDQDMAEIIQQKLAEEGVSIVFERSPDEIIGDNEIKAVRCNGEEFLADLLFMTTGYKTNVQFANANGIELGPSGGFKTDMRAKTNLSEVYAAGDCAECTNLLTGELFLPQLGTVATRQGTAAGINAAGGEAQYPGALGAGVSKISGLEFGSTGLTQGQAEEEKMDPVSASIKWRTRAEYYPGWKDIKAKLVADRASGRLIGAQIAGGERVASMVDTVTTAIQAKMTVRDFAAVDTCYAPPVSDCWNPLILAAENLLRRMRQ